MRAIGLPGRAFLPLVVGFGCNVPAISGDPDPARRPAADPDRAAGAVHLLQRPADRLRDARQRSSSARAPAPSCSRMYVISILLVVLVGLVLRRTLWRTMGAEPLVLDLPAYQRADRCG